MDKSAVRLVARFLSDCYQVPQEQDGREAMLLYLHRLYDISRRLAIMAPVTNDRDLEFVLRMMGKKAQTLRRQIEERLGVRNQSPAAPRSVTSSPSSLARMGNERPGAFRACDPSRLGGTRSRFSRRRVVFRRNLPRMRQPLRPVPATNFDSPCLCPGRRASGFFMRSIIRPGPPGQSGNGGRMRTAQMVSRTLQMGYADSEHGDGSRQVQSSVAICGSSPPGQVWQAQCVA
jgi:hypothetical protein